ncbi:MAG: acetate--CoA ligase family protein [Candidatus Micrarchaeales archaeon]|jgi:acetyl coenzyme A synthetase (ADP forming)-like protein
MKIEALFSPKSVVIIGASREPSKVGNVILRNFLKSYKGKIFAVNPNADYILGVKCYKSILDIKEKVDLAVIVVQAEIVPKVLEECGEKKVKAAIVISSGFAEVGRKDLEEKIKTIAKKYDIALLGPNCLGVFDPKSGVDTLFLPEYKLKRPGIGDISFLTQSGAIGSVTLDLFSDENIGIDKFISYGNATVLDETSLLEYLLKKKTTKVILFYVEGVKRGKEFVKILRKAKKPIVVMKGGISQKGIEAAFSHTAALTSNSQNYLSLFKQFGLISVERYEELFDFAKIFATQPKTKGKNVGIVTNGGGAGVIATDAVYANNLQLAQLSDETKNFLKDKLPNYVNIKNPLDIAGDADAKRFEIAIEAMLNEKNVDMLLLILLFQTPGADTSIINSLTKYKNSQKPLIVATMGGAFTRLHKSIIEASGIPVYMSPNSAVKALKALYDYSHHFK